MVRHGGRLRDSAWCGAACGLLYLAEYALLPVLLPVVLLVTLAQRERRRAHVFACLLGFLILAGPWTLRDWRLSGGPFSTPRARSIASFTDTYPQTDLYRQSPGEVPSSLSFVAGHPKEIVKKALHNVSAFQARVPGVLEGALLLLLGIAVLGELKRAEARRLRWVTFGGAGLLAVNLAIGVPSFEMLYAFLGLGAVLSAVALLHLLRSRALTPRGTTAALACVIALAASQLVLTVALHAEPENPNRDGLKYMNKALSPDALVVTDEPWAVAWYADRPALWIPQETRPDTRQALTPEVADATRRPIMLALGKMGFVPSAIYLTSRLPNYAETEEMTRWLLLRNIIGQQVLTSKEPWAPPGWRVTNTFAPAELLLQRTEAPAPSSAPASGTKPGSSRGTP